MGLGLLDHQDHQYVVHLFCVVSIPQCVFSKLTFDSFQGRMGPRGLKGVPGVNGSPVRNIMKTFLVCRDLVMIRHQTLN